MAKVFSFENNLSEILGKVLDTSHTKLSKRTKAEYGTVDPPNNFSFNRYTTGKKSSLHGWRGV